MKWLIENWYVIIGLFAIAVFVIAMVVKFHRMPTEKQKEALKEWLKYGVSMAEIDLGSGTGQLKLRKVYNMAIEKFPWIATIYSFANFSNDVDEALEWLDKQLNSNESIKKLVKGE